MKHLFLKSALVLVAASAAANASLIVTPTVIPAGTGNNDSIYDEVIFHVTGWNNTSIPDASTPQNGVNGITGTFTANGGGVLSVPAKTTAPAKPFTNYITNAQGGLDAIGSTPASYANFENTTAGQDSRSPNTNTPTSLTGTWFTTGTTPDPTETTGNPSPDTRIMPTDLDAGTADDNGFDNTLLGAIFVTHGDTVSFSGTDGTLAGTEPLSFTSTVPEPASLGILAVGVGGLMLRRRK